MRPSYSKAIMIVLRTLRADVCGEKTLSVGSRTCVLLKQLEDTHTSATADEEATGDLGSIADPSIWICGLKPLQLPGPSRCRPQCAAVSYRRDQS